MCFVFIWEQTATCATYSINWLVFITEMKSVYCAVRTVSLIKAVCASSFLFIRGIWREGTAGRLTTGCWGVWLRVWPPLALLQNLLRHLRFCRSGPLLRHCRAVTNQFRYPVCGQDPDSLCSPNLTYNWLAENTEVLVNYGECGKRTIRFSDSRFDELVSIKNTENAYSNVINIRFDFLARCSLL